MGSIISSWCIVDNKISFLFFFRNIRYHCHIFRESKHTWFFRSFAKKILIIYYLFFLSVPIMVNWWFVSRLFSSSTEIKQLSIVTVLLDTTSNELLPTQKRIVNCLPQYIPILSVWIDLNCANEITFIPYRTILFGIFVLKRHRPLKDNFLPLLENFSNRS